MNILNNMIHSSLFNIYCGPNIISVHQQWQALTSYFDHPTVSNRIDLLMQLVNIRQKTDQSIDEYLHELTELISKLSDLQFAVEDQWKFTLCVNELLPQFTTVGQVS